MNFYEYCLTILVVILVIISVINISKMIILVSKTKFLKTDGNDILNKSVRNLLLSVGLLSIASLIYILIIFKQI